MNLNPISQEWRCRHAFADVVLGFFGSLAIAATIVYFIPPAWAVSFPVGNLFVVDIGDLPPWIASLVALAIWWDARKAKKSAAEAAALAAAGVKSIGEVAVKVDGLLADRDKAKVHEGAAIATRAGIEAAAQLARGQQQGRDAERESVAAGVPIAAAADSKRPLPVADDRTGKASDRVAEATERMADAAEVAADKKDK